MEIIFEFLSTKQCYNTIIIEWVSDGTTAESATDGTTEYCIQYLLF